MRPTYNKIFQQNLSLLKDISQLEEILRLMRDAEGLRIELIGELNDQRIIDLIDSYNRSGMQITCSSLSWTHRVSKDFLEPQSKTK